MIDELLQHQHPLWADVVEGDGEVTTAVHALMFPVLDILNMRTRNYILLDTYLVLTFQYQNPRLFHSLCVI